MSCSGVDAPALINAFLKEDKSYFFNSIISFTNRTTLSGLFFLAISYNRLELDEILSPIIMTKSSSLISFNASCLWDVALQISLCKVTF